MATASVEEIMRVDCDSQLCMYMNINDSKLIYKRVVILCKNTGVPLLNYRALCVFICYLFIYDY